MAFVVFLNLGLAQPANPMPTTAPYISQQLDGVLKNIITRDLTFDPLSYDPQQHSVWNPRWRELSRMIDQSPNIRGFAARGGKLLLAHGLQDVRHAAEEVTSRHICRSPAGPSRPLNGDMRAMAGFMVWHHLRVGSDSQSLELTVRSPDCGQPSWADCRRLWVPATGYLRDVNQIHSVSTSSTCRFVASSKNSCGWQNRA
jgi:hypothetical protein